MSDESEFNLNEPKDVEDRLHFFVTWFVNEMEATLTSHYKVLFGDLKKVGELEKVLGEILGAGAKYFQLNGVDSLLKKVLEIPFEDYYKSRCYKYFDIVYNFHNNRLQGRSLFVRIAIEVFQSFELQFMGVTGDQTYHEAIKKLGMDAAQRFLNFAKENDAKSPSSSEDLPAKKLEAQNVVYGKSKEEFLDKFKIEKRTIQIKSKNIPCPMSKKPGYEILHGNEIWNTANLFEKSGLVISDPNEIKLFARTQSKCRKYLFRRPFKDENWMQEYVILLKTSDYNINFNYAGDHDYYKKQHEVILRKINIQDGTYVLKRSLELIEEFSTIVIEGLVSVSEVNKKHHEEVIDILRNESNCIQNQLLHINKIVKEVKDEIEVSKELIIQKSDLILDGIKLLKQNMPVEIKKVTFGLSNPVKYFTGRQEQLEMIHRTLTENKKTTIISQAVSITGLGGIGKTELAVKYANDYSDYFDSIVFINSEKKENIETSFKSLAVLLGIQIMDEKKNEGSQSTQQEINIKDIVQSIYRYFDVTKVLIIFDNVEAYSSIKDVIHSGSSRSKNISTLITSRNRNWDVGEKGEIELIQLEKFTEDEAMNFVKNSLSNENEKDVKKLITTLGRLPLAMKQAIGYIKEQNKKIKKRGPKKLTVNDYLNLYEKENATLLDIGHNPTDDVYNKTVMTTWMITIKKIEENTQCGKLALNIFNILAYLSPENIHIEELFSDLVTDEEEMWNAVELLDLYSMIDLNQGVAHIHRLVQQVTRNRLKSTNEEENVLRQALTLLNGSFFEDHVVSVWEYSSNYSQLIDDFYTISEYGVANSNVLHLLAAYRSDFKALESILKRSTDIPIDLHKQNWRCQTALHLAAKHGHVDVFKYLVEKGAEKRLKKFFLSTTLFSAAVNGQVEIIKFILTKRDILEVVNKETVLEILDVATLNGQKNVIQFLKPIDNEVHSFYAHFMSIFLKGKYEDCKVLIEDAYKKDPNILQHKFEPDKNSILHIVAKKGNVEIVETLVNGGIDINICNCFKETPLHFAAEAGNCDVLNFFLEREEANYKAEDSCGKTLLHCAATACKVEVLETLIEKGLDYRRATDNGRLPIHFAASGNNINALKFCLVKGVDLESGRESPLNYISTLSECTEMIQLLIELPNAKINTADRLGFTPLNNASYFNRYENVKTLLAAGADPDISDIAGNTAIHGAAKMNNLKVVKLLLKKGADPNLVNIYGNTPLHEVIISFSGCFSVVEVLVQYGCNIRAVNKDRKNALDLAISLNKKRIADFLRNEMKKKTEIQ
ncbi:uncharacterized protein LOC143908937 [Arctopsyche grandis]|uniref:uncharacterized protein LOC143908937 n=1 Tax=Arctopsyche grandis TaxID=121162 RepID=UPI00406D7CDD